MNVSDEYRKALDGDMQAVRDYLRDYPNRRGRYAPFKEPEPGGELGFAWAAGIMDGEGCILLTERRISLRVVMTHEVTIRTFAEVVRVPSFFVAPHNHQVNPKHKIGYGWQASARPDVYQVLMALVPYMVTKRELAEEALSEVQWRMIGRERGWLTGALRPPRPDDFQRG